MASIHTHRTTKGERRYEVRYRESDGHQRSRTFSAHRDAQAFRLDVERRRPAGAVHNVERRRLFSKAEIAEWLESHNQGRVSGANRRRSRRGT
mgnify:CR=1 FL=1